MDRKILFTAGREIEYVRNKIIVNSLIKYFDTTILVDKGKNYLVRFIRIISKLFFRRNSEDVLFIGFYGTPIMFFSKLFFKNKIIFDAFVTTFDTVCFDRKIIKPSSLLGRIIFYFDKRSLSIANHILVDTEENKNYICNTFSIPRSKVSSIPVSCDEEIFFRDKNIDNEDFILFYSTYQPLHGTKIILEAASILEKKFDTQFYIYGNGQEFKDCLELLSKLGLKNTHLLNPVPYIQLPTIISKAKICLGGPFGNTHKAKRVITGKTYQFLYLAKPVIVSNTTANRELLTPGWDAEFCEINNPESLAVSINKLLTDQPYSKKISKNGFDTYNKLVNNNIVENKICEMIKKI